MSDYVQIHVRVESDVTVVTFGENKIFNDWMIEQIGNELIRLAAGDDVVRVVVDFREVEDIHAALLGKLITLNKKLKAKGGALRLCGMVEKVKEYFTITYLDQLFDIKDDLEEAVAAFS